MKLGLGMTIDRPDTVALFKGDWRTAPEHCGGFVDVWDQTIGCHECQMNLWYTPTGEADMPAWLDNATYVALVIANDDKDPDADVFHMVHPFIFDDAHDPGDEDDAKDWPAMELYLQSTVYCPKFGDSDDW